jgi:hypothetical protein
VAGSRSGIGGTSIRPAPRLPRLDRLLVPRREPRLVDRVPVEDDDARPEVPEGREPGPDRPDGPVVAGLAATDATAGDATAGDATAGDATAAIPHTLQYPSSIVPAHPGVRVQDVMGTPAVVPDG